MEEEKVITVTQRIMEENAEIYTDSSASDNALMGHDAQIHVEPWNRTTIADGLWLQENAIAPFSARDILLANEIDDTNRRVASLEEGATDGREIKTLRPRIFSGDDSPWGLHYYELLPYGDAVKPNTLSYYAIGEEQAVISMTQNESTVQFEIGSNGARYRKLNTVGASIAYGDASGYNSPAFKRADISDNLHNGWVGFYTTKNNPEGDEIDVLTSGGLQALVFSNDFNVSSNNGKVNVDVKYFPSHWIAGSSEVDKSEETDNTDGYYHGTEYKLASTYSTTIAEGSSATNGAAYGHCNLILEGSTISAGISYIYGILRNTKIGQGGNSFIYANESQLNSFSNNIVVGQQISAYSFNDDIIRADNLERHGGTGNIIDSDNSCVTNASYNMIFGNNFSGDSLSYIISDGYVNSISSVDHYLNLANNTSAKSVNYGINLGDKNKWESCNRIIVDGDANFIENSNHDFVLGDYNTLSGTAKYDFVAGSGNKVYYSTYNSYINGDDNDVHSTVEYISIEGKSNSANSTVYHSSIVGNNNELYYTSNYTEVYGDRNSLHNSVYYSNVFGNDNELYYSTYYTSLYGDNNNLESCSSTYANGFNITTNDSNNRLAYAFLAGTDISAGRRNVIALGKQVITKGGNAIVVGNNNTNWGDNSFVLGEGNSANFNKSYLFGQGLKTSKAIQFVVGEYNVSYEDSILEIGAGTEDNRQTIFRVDRNGNVYARGSISANANI